MDKKERAKVKQVRNKGSLCQDHLHMFCISHRNIVYCIQNILSHAVVLKWAIY